MLNITGMNRFYYIRNFTDMRCKYSRVLAVIRHQLGREPERDEVFIVMSKNRRLVRLFSFDRISFSLYEKRFAPEYEFMKVVREGSFRNFMSVFKAYEDGIFHRRNRAYPTSVGV